MPALLLLDGQPSSTVTREPRSLRSYAPALPWEHRGASGRSWQMGNTTVEMVPPRLRNPSLEVTTSLPTQNILENKCLPPWRSRGVPGNGGQVGNEDRVGGSTRRTEPETPTRRMEVWGGKGVGPQKGSRRGRVTTPCVCLPFPLPRVELAQGSLQTVSAVLERGRREVGSRLDATSSLFTFPEARDKWVPAIYL